MKKRLLVGILVAIMVMVTLSTTAFAAPKNGKGNGRNENSYSQNGRNPNGYTNGNNKNNKNNKFNQSQVDRDYEEIEKLVAWTNNRIEVLVARAQATPEDDVEQLIAEVDMLIANVMNKAAAKGISIQCTYTAYEIDGRTVLIDPLKVINKRV